MPVKATETEPSLIELSSDPSKDGPSPSPKDQCVAGLFFDEIAFRIHSSRFYFLQQVPWVPWGGCLPWYQYITCDLPQSNFIFFHALYRCESLSLHGITPVLGFL